MRRLLQEALRISAMALLAQRECFAGLQGLPVQLHRAASELAGDAQHFLQSATCQPPAHIGAGKHGAFFSLRQFLSMSMK